MTLLGRFSSIIFRPTDTSWIGQGYNCGEEKKEQREKKGVLEVPRESNLRHADRRLKIVKSTTLPTFNFLSTFNLLHMYDSSTMYSLVKILKGRGIKISGELDTPL